MSETPIRPLRARMIEEMNVRKLGEKTQNDYMRHVKTFSTLLRHSLVKVTPEDLRRFQVHQSKAGTQPPTINSSLSGGEPPCDNCSATLRSRTRNRSVLTCHNHRERDLSPIA
jgi:hypothetical protein